MLEAEGAVITFANWVIRGGEEYMNSTNTKKTILIFLIITLACFVLAGCIAKNKEWSNLTASEYKKNIDCYSGQLAAIYDGRVYFASGEGDLYGIYSMNLDGTDLYYECSTDKIIKIIISDNKLYYIGLSNVGKSRDERYSLYKYDKDEQETKFVGGDGSYESVENAIILNENEIILRKIGRIGSSKAANSKIDILSEFSQTPKRSAQLFNIDDSYYFRILLYEKYIITLVEHSYFSYNENSKLNFDYNDAVYVIDTGETLMWQIRERTNCDLKVINMNEEYIFLSYLNELIALDIETLTESYRSELDSGDINEKIEYMFEFEELQYLIASLEDNKKSLYVNDTQNLAFKKIMDFDENKVLIHVDNGWILYSSDDEIYCQKANANGLGEMIYTIKFDENIVYNNIFEIAGNWLFIYDRGKLRETSPLKLLHRVDLDSGEIIE